MRILLDTNALLWTLGEDKRLGRKARLLVEDGANIILVSSVSLAECYIKARAGKLHGIEKLSEMIDRQQFTMLDFDTAAADTMQTAPVVPWGDPFDTMLMSHAVSRDMWFMSSDNRILGLAWPQLRRVDAQD